MSQLTAIPSGEGSDSDMPSHIWEQIHSECRKHFGGLSRNASEVITVRLTNHDE